MTPRRDPSTPPRVIGDDRRRLLSHAERAGSGCLLWTASTIANGYGVTWYGGRTVVAHRAAYELFVGPIPEGLHLDHLCHNQDPLCPGGATCLHRRCIEPAHLDPVTQAENNRRTASPSCRQGHERAKHSAVTPAGRVVCRLCQRAGANRRYAEGRGRTA